MLTELQKAQQKYGGANKIIDSWLEERRDLLVRYCKLAGLPPFEAEKGQLPSHEEVIQFCQVLVDYLSAGHFEVFDNIVSQCKVNGGESLELAKTLWPKINTTTDIALKFDATYAELDENADWGSFDTDLSDLGQALEDRFDFEDQLINNLFTKHSEVA
ncbi:Rsd/AlgQ family anti-sigma factor [Catenovulum sp. SX2]|uniref:Rsd/AlgQ family anti-sigma factor n=1 Tax=Catenovulum TaxID=1172191 RepID=UPI0002FD8766|nr:Rsd/AlgQ family anti-sigma factor [Catenovulum agarivorans]